MFSHENVSMAILPLTMIFMKNICGLTVKKKTREPMVLTVDAHLKSGVYLDTFIHIFRARADNKSINHLFVNALQVFYIKRHFLAFPILMQRRPKLTLS